MENKEINFFLAMLSPSEKYCIDEGALTADFGTRDSSFLPWVGLLRKV